jgi:hypothetical protein
MLNLFKCIGKEKFKLKIKLFLIANNNDFYKIKQNIYSLILKNQTKVLNKVGLPSSKSILLLLGNLVNSLIDLKEKATGY